MRALRLVTLALVLVAPAAHADRLDVGDYGPADLADGRRRRSLT